MGDIRILDPRMDPRFGSDTKHRPWPPLYRSTGSSRGPSFCYRPVPVPLETLTQWITPLPEYNYMPARIQSNTSNKGRDYYYLTPMYRNAMPPPTQTLPPMQGPQMGMSPRLMLMERPRTRAKSSGGIGRNSVPPCTCAVGRARSLEDVRSEISEWDEYHDENGNRIKTNPKTRITRCNRKSMENLLDANVVDSNFEGTGKSGKSRKIEDRRSEKCHGKRRGSYMVRLKIVHSISAFITV